MKDEILKKAPGMRFVMDINESGGKKVKPRVIHALGNIKWGFTQGMKPVPVEQIQSKWDKGREEEGKKLRRSRSVEDLEEFKPTSKAVNWTQVIRRYLTLRGREVTELKEAKEEEHSVRDIMKSLVDIRNDGASQTARLQAVKWTKIPGETKRQVIEKWEEKARK